MLSSHQRRLLMSPEDLLCEKEDEATLHESVASQLRERERAALTSRFGLDGDAERTFAEAGDQLSVSRERVRQLVESGLARLRHGCSFNYEHVAVRMPDPHSINSRVFRDAEGRRIILHKDVSYQDPRTSNSRVYRYEFFGSYQRIAVFPTEQAALGYASRRAWTLMPRTREPRW